MIQYEPIEFIDYAIGTLTEDGKNPLNKITRIDVADKIYEIAMEFGVDINKVIRYLHAPGNQGVISNQGLKMTEGEVANQLRRLENERRNKKVDIGIKALIMSELHRKDIGEIIPRLQHFSKWLLSKPVETKIWLRVYSEKFGLDEGAADTIFAALAQVPEPKETAETTKTAAREQLQALDEIYIRARVMAMEPEEGIRFVVAHSHTAAEIVGRLQSYAPLVQGSRKAATDFEQQLIDVTRQPGIAKAVVDTLKLIVTEHTSQKQRI